MPDFLIVYADWDAVEQFGQDCVETLAGAAASSS